MQISIRNNFEANQYTNKYNFLEKVLHLSGHSLRQTAEVRSHFADNLEVL
jgi:hypothetical protein